MSTLREKCSNTDQKKTPYFDTFRAVAITFILTFDGKFFELIHLNENLLNENFYLLIK